MSETSHAIPDCHLLEKLMDAYWKFEGLFIPTVMPFDAATEGRNVTGCLAGSIADHSVTEDNKITTIGKPHAIRPVREWLKPMVTSAVRSMLRAVLLIALTTTGTAYAQSYPDKPVHFIIGLSPGMNSDTTMRIIAQKLGKIWGQSALIFNRPGAGGNIAANLVAKAAPDGYTMLITTDSFAIAPSYFKKLAYDPVKDLVPVSLVASLPHLICVNPSLPIYSVKDLIALAKSKPDDLAFASVGAGQIVHMETELFMHMTGIKMRHIPYNGPQALTAVVNGDVALYFFGLTPALPFIKEGKVRCIAITSATRAPVVPDIPTVEESGVPGFDQTVWTGVFAPAGTPPSIIAKVSRDIAAVLKMPDVRERLTPSGLTLIGSTPAQFDTFFKSEVAKWADLIKATGIGGN